MQAWFVQAATSTPPGKTEKEDAAIAQMMAHEMLCIVLSGVTSNEMKTAALNQLLHHPATSAAAQVCHIMLQPPDMHQKMQWST